MTNLQIACPIIFIVGTLLGFLLGVELTTEPEIELQTSQFMSPHIDFNSLIEEATTDEDMYQVCCPSCKEITIFHVGTGTIYRNMHIVYPTIKILQPGESVEFSVFDGQTYCDECYYPVGTDWRCEVIDEIKQ